MADQEVQIHVGQNLVKSAGGLDGSASHGFLQQRELLGSLEEQIPGKCSFCPFMADTASLNFSSSFLEISICLTFAGLWVG